MLTRDNIEERKRLQMRGQQVSLACAVVLPCPYLMLRHRERARGDHEALCAVGLNRAVQETVMRRASPEGSRWCHSLEMTSKGTRPDGSPFVSQAWAGYSITLREDCTFLVEGMSREQTGLGEGLRKQVFTYRGTHKKLGAWSPLSANSYGYSREFRRLAFAAMLCLTRAKLPRDVISLILSEVAHAEGAICVYALQYDSSTSYSEQEWKDWRKTDEGPFQSARIEAGELVEGVLEATFGNLFLRMTPINGKAV